uniref:hypothetical protein n=1 Tax=Sediminimonas sp. TaxID=2823379 RepID=UPI0025F13E93
KPKNTEHESSSHTTLWAQQTTSRQPPSRFTPHVALSGQENGQKSRCPYVKLGRSVRYRVADLLDYIENNIQPAA